MKKRMTAGMLYSDTHGGSPAGFRVARLRPRRSRSLNTTEHMQYMNGYTDSTFARMRPSPAAGGASCWPPC